jgi:cytochrome bd-type quinol oxidase subunit 2
LHEFRGNAANEHEGAMKIFGLSILALVVGYTVGLFGGMFLVNRLSPNKHDKATEAAMTSAFVIGPAVAVIALVATLVVMFK